MPSQNMLNNHGWDSSTIIRRVDIPDHTQIDSTVLEPSQLSFVAPEIFKPLRESGSFLVDRRTVINETEGILSVMEEADVNDRRVVGYACDRDLRSVVGCRIATAFERSPRASRSSRLNEDSNAFASEPWSRMSCAESSQA